jgi:hypothetical protein
LRDLAGILIVITSGRIIGSGLPLSSLLLLIFLFVKTIGSVQK